MKKIAMAFVFGLLLGFGAYVAAQTPTPGRLPLNTMGQMMATVAVIETQQVNHATGINALATQVPRYAVAGTPAPTPVPTAY